MDRCGESDPQTADPRGAFEGLERTIAVAKFGVDARQTPGARASACFGTERGRRLTIDRAIVYDADNKEIVSLSGRQISRQVRPEMGGRRGGGSRVRVQTVHARPSQPHFVEVAPFLVTSFCTRQLISSPTQISFSDGHAIAWIQPNSPRFRPGWP